MFISENEQMKVRCDKYIIICYGLYFYSIMFFLVSIFTQPNFTLMLTGLIFLLITLFSLMYKIYLIEINIEDNSF